MTQEEHDKKLTPVVKKFKQEIFKDDKIILHYVDYTRNKNGFEQMTEKPFREKFYKHLNHIIKSTNFALVACIIDKEKHKEKYKALAIDPYTLSLEIVVERFVRLLQDQNEKGVII